MLQFSFDNNSFLADHALPQYFTIIMIIIMREEIIIIREFRDAIKLRYDWEIADLPAMCTCGDLFTVDHAMVCRHGGWSFRGTMRLGT